jgi:hypothetical protein
MLVKILNKNEDLLKDKDLIENLFKPLILYFWSVN